MSNYSKNEATKDKKNRQLRDKRNTLANDDGTKGSKKKKKSTVTTTDQKGKIVASLPWSDKQESGVRKLVRSTSRISSGPAVKEYTGNSVNQLRLERNGMRREEERTGSVTKTKYFPSQKDIIHRVVKEEKIKRDIKNQPSKVVQNETKRGEVDRPRTATLKEASVSHLTKKLPPTSTKEEQVNYDDDFDSYESDFEDENEEEEEKTDNNTNKSTSLISESVGNVTENESSTPEDDFDNDVMATHCQLSFTSKEHKLDSGNFDLQDRTLKTNNATATQELLSPVPPPNSLLSDEGYDEGKFFLKKSYGFDFERTRIEERKRLEHNKRRGKEIQTMIKFNKCYFTTFEMTPVPYEQFIQIHGQTLGIQYATQTVTTSNVDENVQTNEIITTTKWTQFPAVFSRKLFSERQKSNWELYRQEFLGVGNDSKAEQIQEEAPHYRSDKFINSATIVLSLLNNETNKKFYKSVSVTNDNESFSTGSTKTCAQDVDVLHDTSIIDLYTSNSNNFLTIHLPSNKNFTEASYVCVWNASSLQLPLALLRTMGRPTSADFGGKHINYVFVGFKDGTLTLWNTNNENLNEKYCLLSSASFKTKINDSHQTNITSVLCAPNKNSEKGLPEEKVYSLDEDGLLISWTTVTKTRPKWNVSLVQNCQLHLKAMCSNPYYGMEFKRLYFNPLDSNHLFILSNSDRVLHCYSTGSKIYPKHYKTDDLSVVTSMGCSPFSSTYFIAGYENGKVALFSRNVQKSLMILSNEGNRKRASIDTVQWSGEKPCIFYAKDDKNVLHVWNLALSDIFPIYSIPFKENVVSIKVTTPQKRKEKIYMIIATRDGQLSVHFLNNEHKSLTNEEYDTDVKYFFNYVKRL